LFIELGILTTVTNSVCGGKDMGVLDFARDRAYLAYYSLAKPTLRLVVLWHIKVFAVDTEFHWNFLSVEVMRLLGYLMIVKRL
jgi:hypothetical protein